MKHHFRTSAWFIALLGLLCVGSASGQRLPAPAAVPAPPPDRAGAPIIRVYNINDLLYTRRDYPLQGAVSLPMVPPERAMEELSALMGGRGGGARGGGGGRGGGEQNIFGQPANPLGAQPARQDELTSEIIALIRETVDPPSWVDAGGQEGLIKFLGGMLIITQAPKNHEAIANLLGQLRQESGRMVTLRAWWILAPPAEVQKLVGGKEQTASALPQVNRDALALALDSNLSYRGQTTCFNGQTVHITSGRSHTAVVGLEAVTSGGSALYNPRTATLHAGAMLQIRPLLSEDGARVVLDIQSIVSEIDPGDDAQIRFAPATQPAGGASATIDRLNVLTQQLRTTIAAPLGKPVLVGGMTFVPTTKAKDAAQFQLIVEAVAQ